MLMNAFISPVEMAFCHQANSKWQKTQNMGIIIIKDDLSLPFFQPLSKRLAGPESVSNGWGKNSGTFNLPSRIIVHCPVVFFAPGKKNHVIIIARHRPIKSEPTIRFSCITNWQKGCKDQRTQSKVFLPTKFPISNQLAADTLHRHHRGVAINRLEHCIHIDTSMALHHEN